VRRCTPLQKDLSNRFERLTIVLCGWVMGGLVLHRVLLRSIRPLLVTDGKVDQTSHDCDSQFTIDHAAQD
jgi:hypothetical protein